MRFLADENIYPQVILFLRRLGHDVHGLQESGLFKITDDKIIDLAIKEERTIITFDKHFGDVLRYPPEKSPGIILIRIHPPVSDDIFHALKNLFNNYPADTVKGKLIVLSKAGYRIRE